MLLQSDAVLKAREAREHKDQDHLKDNCTESFTVKEGTILHDNIPRGKIGEYDKLTMRPTLFTLEDLMIVCFISWKTASRRTYEK